MRRTAIAIGLAAALSLPSAPAAAGNVNATSDPCDWDGYGNGTWHPNAVTAGCSTIDATSVGRLTPKAFYRTRDSVTATPAVVDGVAYVGTWDGTFYAFPADATGFGDPSTVTDPVETVAPLWTFAIDDPNGVSFGRIVSSATVTDPVTIGSGANERTTRLVVFAGGSTIYVLDAADGSKVASLCVDPRTTSRCAGTTSGEVEVETSPMVVPNGSGSLRIVVGNDVHNDANVGRTGVIALDLSLATASMTPAWKFDPEGSGPGDADGETYRPGDGGGDVLTRGAGTGLGCGGVWSTPAIDPESDVVVFGIASCPRDVPAGPDGEKGTADDVVGALPGEKVYAVRLSDGAFRWRYSPPRPWGARTDDDFGSSPNLFRVDGRLVAGAGSKDGAYYALDALTGDLLWRSAAGQPGHANEDFAIGGIIGTPAVGEATIADGLGLTTVPAVFATTAISTPIGAPVDYGTFESIDRSLLEDPGRMLSLHAIDARNGRVLWRQPLHRQSYGHPTFVNGLVIVPATAGFNVAAYDASTGTPLWSRPVNGAPSSGVAVAGDTIFIGAGTRQTDAGFKIFGDDSVFPDFITGLVPPAAEDLLGADPQERLGGIWSFSL